MPRKLTTEQWIEKAKAKHGDRYDYSKVEYKKAHDKVSILCREHGAFSQAANDHIKGSGCKKCRSDKMSVKQFSNAEAFKLSAEAVHGSEYSYDNVEYKGARSKVSIICSVHGDFRQTPNCHLNGCGCPKCAWRHTGKTLVYLVMVSAGDDTMLKIGITNYTVEDRFNKVDCTLVSNIATLEFKERSDAKTIEAYLHAKHKRHQFTPKVKFAGHTECFNIEALETIKQDFGV